MDDYENEALPVGEAQVAEAIQTLQRYKAGKAALDKRAAERYGGGPQLVRTQGSGKDDEAYLI